MRTLSGLSTRTGGYRSEVIVLLTCLVLIVATGLCAEAVRAGCRRRLMTPLAVRRDPAASVRELELAGVRALD